MELERLKICLQTYELGSALIEYRMAEVEGGIIGMSCAWSSQKFSMIFIAL